MMWAWLQRRRDRKLKRRFDALWARLQPEFEAIAAVARVEFEEAWSVWQDRDRLLPEFVD